MTVTFRVFLAALQQQWPSFEPVPLFFSAKFKVKAFSCRAARLPPGGVHLVSEHVVPSWNISDAIKIQGVLESGGAAQTEKITVVS